MKEADSEEVAKILGEPVQAEFSAHTQRIRTRLIATSFIAVFCVISGVSLRADSAFLGLKFDGLTDLKVFGTLLVLTLYFLIHFLWLAYDNFLLWRVRQTATNRAFQPMELPPAADYSIKASNSTLYNWWTTRASEIDRTEESLAKTRIVVENLKACVEEIFLEKKNSGKSDSWMKKGSENLRGHSVDAYDRITRMVELTSTIQNLISSKRIQTSLARFDACYRRLLRSDNLRWIIIELFLPLLLGVIAIGLISVQLYSLNREPESSYVSEALVIPKDLTNSLSISLESSPDGMIWTQVFHSDVDPPIKENRLRVRIVEKKSE